jgi:two-component system LytT family sensor kinase
LTNSDKTSDIVLKLSSLLSYIIYDSNERIVSLEQEKEFIENYLNLEKTRLENGIVINFNYNVQNAVKIPPLLFLPLLDNAFKHSSSNANVARYVNINIFLNNSDLIFEIKNSLNMFSSKKLHDGKNGIGINNIKTRLKLLYDNNYSYESIVSNNKYYVKVILKNITNEKNGMCHC